MLRVAGNHSAKTAGGKLTAKTKPVEKCRVWVPDKAQPHFCTVKFLSNCEICGVTYCNRHINRHECTYTKMRHVHPDSVSCVDAGPSGHK